MWAVMGLFKEFKPLYSNEKIVLSNENGLIGAMPVFDDYDKAKEFAGDRFEILELKTNK